MALNGVLIQVSVAHFHTIPVLPYEYRYLVDRILLACFEIKIISSSFSKYMSGRRVGMHVCDLDLAHETVMIAPNGGITSYYAL